MKRKTIITAVVILLLGGIGTIKAFTSLEKEEPQEIRGIIVDKHDSIWYETQQRLWLQKAENNPTDEHAWQQSFEAARYADMLIGEYGRTNRKQAILDKMNKNIPNSFVYNLCMYMNEMGIPGGNPDPYAKQAPQLTNSSISRRSHYWGWIATPTAAAVGLLIGLFINRQSETKNDFVVPIVAVETNGHNILDDNTDYSMFISM